MTTRLYSATLLALLAIFLTAPDAARAVNCDKKPDHPACGGDGGDGGDPGNEMLPLTIDFVDALAVTDDGSPYVDDPDGSGVEAFIGSQAKSGDIVLRLQDTTPPRFIDVTFGATTDSIDPDCGSPPSGLVTLRHLEVDVQDGAGTPQGVYDLSDEDPDVNVPMRARLEVGAGGQVWVLNYGTGENKLCGASTNAHDSVWVIKTQGADEWTVGTFDLNGDPVGSLACLEKAGAGKGDKTKFCGRYEMPFSFTATPQ